MGYFVEFGSNFATHHLDAEICKKLRIYKSLIGRIYNFDLQKDRDKFFSVQRLQDQRAKICYSLG
jgi:hypothetical protein